MRLRDAVLFPLAALYEVALTGLVLLLVLAAIPFALAVHLYDER